jgi:hypothetical protein
MIHTPFGATAPHTKHTVYISRAAKNVWTREKRGDAYFSEWTRSFPIHGVIAQSIGANENSGSGNGEFTKAGHNADLNDHSKEALRQCPSR